MLGQQPDTTVEELAVEFMMVRLALAIEPHLTGYSHIQTNPRWSYDKQKTVKNAERMLPTYLPWLAQLLRKTNSSCRNCGNIQASRAGL